MKLTFKLICIVIFFSFGLKENYISANTCYSDELDEKETQEFRTIDEVLQELKEERKVIEQQKLQELENKRLEKESKEKNNEGDKFEVETPLKPEKTMDIEKEKEMLPNLIVRLRGKHSTKYLCSYNFLVHDVDKELELNKEKIVDYSSLLNKPSLKVRPGEYINFEFKPKAKEIKAYVIDGSSKKEINVKRGSISVPNYDKKIIILIEGIFENGNIKFAIILDIRSE